MPSFSKRSADNLSTCHHQIQAVLNEAIKDMDFSVIAGYRDEKTQNSYYEQGTSKLKYPHSKHNKYPSMAVDIIPYPFHGWDDYLGFHKLANHILQTAILLGVRVRWGGTWRTFKDLPHFEII